MLHLKNPVPRIYSLAITRLLVFPLLLATYVGANEPQKNVTKYVCVETSAKSLGDAGNACGSASNPCSVDLKRSGSSASATPSVPGAKGNSPFTVGVGTTVTWQSSSKNAGFIVDFGPSSPFDPSGAIIGGSDHQVSVVAKRPGCYRFSVGVCVSGATYGMCKEANAEMVVTAGSN
jgi:hypothetical protein